MTPLIADRRTVLWGWAAVLSLLVVSWSAGGLSAAGYEVNGLFFLLAVACVLVINLFFARFVHADSALTEHLQWRFGRVFTVGPLAAIDFLLFSYWPWYRKHTRYRSDPERPT